MKNQGWEQSEVTLPLRNQINEYVKQIWKGTIPRIPFSGYRSFRDQGSRIESEKAYFEVRKQLTALGTYFQWAEPKEAEITYFNELLWSVANEFTWCLAAHLSYEKEGFAENQDKNIDLFAAETAVTLAEIICLQEDRIDPYIRKYVQHQIRNRVLEPFLDRSWGWETSHSNWSAVCAGSIGMAALYLERSENRERILEKVDRAIVHYLQGFGEDGATEEGVGYWAYGFGYYIYYTALRKERDPGYQMEEAVRSKIKKIAEFPRLIQIAQDSYVPFSDAECATILPTGLLSYLQGEFDVLPPVCSEITNFDFDHCYRFAHISRNLWWTKKELFSAKSDDFIHYFPDKQWFTQRMDSFFFAAKGGSNTEEHNHNDVGSFLLALDGELILTDLGAGPYTADYFGEKRYQFTHTRSYWHNVPLIREKEQIPTANHCDLKEVYIDGTFAEIKMELSGLYDIPELGSFYRYISSNAGKKIIILRDDFASTEPVEVEEGFISRIKPLMTDPGVIRWKANRGWVTLRYNEVMLVAAVEEATVMSHLNEEGKAYRIGLRTREKAVSQKIEIEISFS